MFVALGRSLGRNNFNSFLAVHLLLALLVGANVCGNEHAMFVEFAAIPIIQEMERTPDVKTQPAVKNVAQQVGTTPELRTVPSISVGSDRRGSRQDFRNVSPPKLLTSSATTLNDRTQLSVKAKPNKAEQVEPRPWVSATPKPAVKRAPVRVADRPISEKIRAILREADQIGPGTNLPLYVHDPSANHEAAATTSSPETKEVGVLAGADTKAVSLLNEKTGSQETTRELLPTFDERRPVEAEFIGSNEFAPHEFMPMQHGHPIHDGHHGHPGHDGHIGQALPMASPDVLASGYDSLVDSFVGQLLADGCATPNYVPGTISLLNPPIGAYHQPIATGWYAQANALFLQPLGSRDLAVSVDGLTDATRIDVGTLHDGLASGASALLGLRTGTSTTEFEWWSLFENRDRERVADPAGDLRWLIPFEQLDVDSTGSAQLHQLGGEYEFHSFELNKRQLLSSREVGALQFAYVWGVRFVRFRDALNFQADPSDTSLDGSAGEYAYEASVDNRLFGPQIGGAAHWQIANRIATALDFRTGVFYNYVEHDQSSSDVLGPATIASGVDAGSVYSIDNSDSQAALIAELKLNLEYVLRPNFRFLVGYRIFGVQNVATAASQIPRSFESLGRLEPTVSDSFVLHGLQFGFVASF